MLLSLTSSINEHLDCLLQLQWGNLMDSWAPGIHFSALAAGHAGGEGGANSHRLQGQLHLTLLSTKQQLIN